MHRRLLQPVDTAGIPPVTVPGLEAVKQLQAALKTSLFLTVSCLLLSWLFGKGSIDLA